MKVHNINGTSDNECKCGTWKAHWEKYNEKHASWPKWCSEKNCVSTPTVGAHVQKEVGADKDWYIIPLCADHNNMRGKSIDIVESTSFASANRGKTCGY